MCFTDGGLPFEPNADCKVPVPPFLRIPRSCRFFATPMRDGWRKYELASTCGRAYGLRPFCYYPSSWPELINVCKRRKFNRIY